MGGCARNVASSLLIFFFIFLVKQDTKSQRIHLRVRGQVIWEERPRKCETVAWSVFEPEAVGNSMIAR